MAVAIVAPSGVGPTFKPSTATKNGVLLVNLGTPTAPDETSVRSYLAEFLSDPRVVAIPRIIWLPLLHGLILKRRPAISAAKYKSIWMPEGSPLAVYTQRQATLLQARLRDHKVVWAMRYGTPSISDALMALKECQQVLVFPLYPQFSESTTASVRDCVPESVLFVQSFYDHPAYIEAVAQGIRRYWELHGQPDILVLSFHGLPQRSVVRGDPYKDQCSESAQLISRALGIGDSRLRVSFQSRFGRARWIQPYTTAVLSELGRIGIGRVDVACPGFVSDCLETLEEIAVEGRAIFRASGGRELRLIPCLNDSPTWIDALAQIALEHCA